MRTIMAIFLLTACGGSVDHKVNGGTTNTVEVSLAEKFCTADEYPTPAERRVCKDALLAAMASCPAPSLGHE